MDVSNILASHSAKQKVTDVEKETPLQIDTGYLTVTDINPIDEETYKSNIEDHLLNLARDGTQVLFKALFSLPTLPSADGPLAQLPPPTIQLPRAKPLPKPKPQTKWEQFASAKGIQKTRKDKKVWDEERQEWVNRWGKDGKNKEKEDAWITEVPHNADVDFDPRKAARDERKSRVAKNEKQRLGNIARSKPTDAKKVALDRTLASSRVSTASMGKFDKKLEGEKKLKGVKRKFDSVETHVEARSSLDILNRMNSDAKKMRGPSTGDGNVLNVRKAVRFASKGQGGVALARRDSKGSKGDRGGNKKRR